MWQPVPGAHGFRAGALTIIAAMVATVLILPQVIDLIDRWGWGSNGEAVAALLAYGIGVVLLWAAMLRKQSTQATFRGLVIGSLLLVVLSFSIRVLPYWDYYQYYPGEMFSLRPEFLFVAFFIVMAIFRPAVARSGLGSEAGSDGTLALVLAGVGMFGLGPFAHVPAVIVGHMARSKAKQSGRETPRAVAALVIGYFGLVAFVLYLILIVLVISALSDL